MAIEPKQLGPCLLAASKFPRCQLFFLVFAALVLTSCTSKDECVDFPGSLSEATRTGVNLSNASRTNALNGAIGKIEVCYSSTAYAQNDFEKSLQRISVGSDGNYYIFFSFIGIEDEWLVFRVSRNGVIDSAFTYSPLSRFAVPVLSK